MYDQRLPIPIGGKDPIRRYRRAWFVRGRDRLRLLLLALGVAAAVSGGLVGARPPVVSVRADSNAYTLGNVSLPAQGGGVYGGSQGAVVIENRLGSLSAGGATTLHGMQMRGSCALDFDRRGELCRFQLGDRSLLAQDTRTQDGWHRRYQDGQQVDIALPDGTVPVPFALGR